MIIHEQNVCPRTRPPTRDLPRVHLVGLKNAGKTTLMIELIGELRRRNYRVGAIKHSPHAHPLDQPGKDSFRHGEAGASPTAFVTGAGTAVFLDASPGADIYALLTPLYADCDLILVEGDIRSPGPRVEVWRAALGRPPLACENPDILAVISDDPAPVSSACWPRRDLAGLASEMAWLAGLRDWPRNAAAVRRSTTSSLRPAAGLTSA
jgi:molybdopterin-guanine dinucleotide biosynthesis adapter protein